MSELIRLSCTKTKVLLTQVYVTLDELDCPVLKLRFSHMSELGGTLVLVQDSLIRLRSHMSE
jgi:hypothetical protein